MFTMIIKFFEDFPGLDLGLQEKLIDSIYISLNTILSNDEVPDYIKEEFKRRFN